MGAVGVNTAFCCRGRVRAGLQSCSDQEESVSAPGDFFLAGQMQADPRRDLPRAELLVPYV